MESKTYEPAKPGAELVLTWRVRRGRECRVCGEDRRTMMARNRSAPDGHTTVCRACAGVYLREWKRQHRDENLERMRSYNHAYYRRTAEARSERLRQHRRENAEAVRERDRQRYRENAEAVREYERQRRQRLAGRTGEQMPADRARLRPDGVKRCRACRGWLPLSAFAVDRVRSDGLVQSCRACANAKLRRRVLPLWRSLGIDPDKCYRCGARGEIHTDHVWPRALGGTDDPSNLWPLCAACNLTKNARDPLEWAADRSRPPWRFHPQHSAWFAAASVGVA